MTILLPKGLPAIEVLKGERRSVIETDQAMPYPQDPFRVGLLNLMPDKVTTETQFARLLAAPPFPVELKLLRLRTHMPKNCCEMHLGRYYEVFDREVIEDLDALIITGAPVEHLEFHEVSYWAELTQAMDLAASHSLEIMGVCWGAMALAFHFHGIKKQLHASKVFGCIEHSVEDPSSPIVFGIEQSCKVPISRWTSLSQDDIDRSHALTTLLTGAKGGPGVIRDHSAGATYVLNHFEYDHDTLAREYFRDLKSGVEINIPTGYFPEDNPNRIPKNVWQRSACILYANWLKHAYCRKRISESRQSAPHNLVRHGSSSRASLSDTLELVL